MTAALVIVAAALVACAFSLRLRPRQRAGNLVLAAFDLWVATW